MPIGPHQIQIVKRTTIVKKVETFIAWCLFFILALSLASTRSFASSEGVGAGGEPQIWINSPLYRNWDPAPANAPGFWGKRADAWKMFVGDGEEWKYVMGKTYAITIAGGPVQNACLENHTKVSPKTCSDLGIDNDKSLDQFFRFIKLHHIRFTLGISLIMDTRLTAGSPIAAKCGSEAFGREDGLRNILERIKAAGGDLDFIQMDEPFWFGVINCKDTAQDVAADLNLTIEKIVRQYFPDVQVGDVEPVVGSPENPGMLGEWADAFRSATGKRLAFFQTDANWGSDSVFRNLVKTEEIMKARSIPFGVMFDSEDESSDLAWTRGAIEHFTMAESYFHIKVDQAVFPSWTSRPTNMLPEKSPGALTNVAYQYLLHPTRMSLVESGNSGRVHLRLTTGEQMPVAGAKVRVEAVDTKKTWPMRDRTLHGVVPEGAAYGLIIMRGNAEGSRMGSESGEVDVGSISLTFEGRTWHVRESPLEIKLSSTTTASANFIIQDGARCNAMSVVPLHPGQPYTLNVPIAATESADHGGYIAVLFVDSDCKGVKRSYLYFSPSSVALSVTSSTNSDGELNITVPKELWTPGVELRAYYDGDNSSYRPTMTVLQVKP